MESTTRTGQLEPASFEPANEAASTDVTTPEPEARPSLTTVVRDQCVACGAPLAADQRYCVECGERSRAPRVPILDVPSRAEDQAASRAGRRARTSINTTLIAGVGTLLLAMGVGVLIGRSGNGTTAKNPPAQIVTVAGSGAASSSPTSPASTPSASAGASTSTKAAAASSSAAAAKSASKASSTPPPKVVKIGSPGKGRGYQHGHFTGKFFGSESESE
jgi:hypothetical protein